MHALFKANQTLYLLPSRKITSSYSSTLALTTVCFLLVIFIPEYHKSVKLFTVHRAPPLDPWRGV